MTATAVVREGETGAKTPKKRQHFNHFVLWLVPIIGLMLLF